MLTGPWGRPIVDADVCVVSGAADSPGLVEITPGEVGRSLLPKWRPLADDTFKYIFMTENNSRSSDISLKSVAEGSSDKSSLVQVMASHLFVTKP